MKHRPKENLGRLPFKEEVAENMSTIPQFYFLTDDYFTDFPDSLLMQNKPSTGGKPHSRPCFFAFKDNKNHDIYWIVPVSSNVAKYRAIAKKQKTVHRRPLTLCFGTLHGRDTAFLIQNMCPVKDRYLIPYLEKNGNPVIIDNKLASKIKRKALSALIMTKNGHKVVYPDIMKIYAALDAETK